MNFSLFQKKSVSLLFGFPSNNDTGLQYQTTIKPLFTSLPLTKPEARSKNHKKMCGVGWGGVGRGNSNTCHAQAQHAMAHIGHHKRLIQ
jgi:hypothetical protein